MNTERIKQAMAQLATLNAKIAQNSACNASSKENHANAIEIVLDALQGFLELGITPEQIHEIDKLYAEKCKELTEEKKKHRWIPCSERLPEDYDNRFYMCVVENNEEDVPMLCQYEEGYGFGFWNDIYNEHTLGFVDSEFKTNEELGYEKVIAWQPLPESYREESV